MNAAERSLLDHPAISGSYLFPQQRYVRDPFNVTVDGAELACYRHLHDPDRLTIMHFHGNGESIADYVPGMADEFAQLGLNSLFVEYREYGHSTGEAHLVAMLGDGETALQAAGLAPEQVIAFGRSLGSLYAIELAFRQPGLAGLILESGIADLSERLLKYVDLNRAGIDEHDLVAEVQRHFNHKRKLSQYQNPLLVLHTEKDGMVDVSHAERNYRWAGSAQKRLVRFPSGNHNTIYGVNARAYLKAIQDFANQLNA